ncbi:lipoyl(octanoyl) transferase LipB [Desulfobacula toluolica]|uniref:Octanoyltransferase n=1 Tax=Desulfobacula toluolica (strain DSM 7467 / Tol2) TaxID=651182 RepID=K0N8M4_DESTT|nr:lipoyl(octanoyl) transferase LipB [Desulfobacula toluolica]CCK80259.1 LipB: lipoyl(octanoyl) transferas (lipoate-protein ligase B) [Desulfobacula toluolica Tol2]
MPERINSSKRSAVFTDLGLMDYNRALDLQIKTLESKVDNHLIEDRIFFVEHPCVFTLGKRGGEENLTVSRKFLTLKNIDVVQTDRGGNITYHGPGQAVMYPVIDLEKNKIGVKDFVHGLEEIMKLTAMEFNIAADRNPRNHGIWVGNSKIGSVGLSVKKGICFHGLAMNINTDLEPFSWINPCGLTNVSMTSIKKEMDMSNTRLGESSNNSSNKKNGTILGTSPGKNHDDISMDRIKKAFVKYFSFVFDYSITIGQEDRF